jgi:hypothetical protein
LPGGAFVYGPGRPLDAEGKLISDANHRSHDKWRRTVGGDLLGRGPRVSWARHRRQADSHHGPERHVEPTLVLDECSRRCVLLRLLIDTRARCGTRVHVVVPDPGGGRRSESRVGLAEAGIPVAASFIGMIVGAPGVDPVGGSQRPPTHHWPDPASGPAVTPVHPCGPVPVHLWWRGSGLFPSRTRP